MEEQTKTKKGNFNPLKKEIVEVRYVRSTSSMYNNPNSPLDGGLAETTDITLAVPRKHGMLVPVLNSDEQKFFEKLFGMPEGSMSPTLIENNYWTTYGKGYINRVTVGKTLRRLDLSNAKDYIEWKILCANNEVVCPSYEMLQSNRLNTYRFVMSNEDAISQTAGATADMKLENFENYAKYKEDADMLRVIIYLIDHKKISPSTQLAMLKSRMVTLMETRVKECHAVLTSNNLEQKKVILIGVEKGIVSDRNGFYYVAETGQKLSEDYEEPNLINAANYLADVNNQELYFSLFKKIK